MTLSWGIAATGRMARSVGAVIVEHPEMRVAAVGSRDGARAAQLAAELGAGSAFASYEDLVAAPDVEAVYVATPHPQHAAVVEAALRAGKAVLCEKPLTASLAETERLVQLAERHGTFLMEALWMRFNPLVAQLQALVRGGGLGAVRSLHASFGFAAPFDPAGRLWDPALGGGALLDIGIYPVDLARLLLGSPSHVEVSGSLAPTGVDAESSLALGWPGGERALLQQSLVADLPGNALVIGSRGWAELSAPFHAPTRLVVRVDRGEPVEHTVLDRRAGLVSQVEEVARCLAAGSTQSRVMPWAESVATMTVLEQARRSLGAAPLPD